MRRRERLKRVGLILVLPVCLISILALGRRPGQSAAPPTMPLDLSAIPLTFEANASQTDPAVRFLAHLPGGVLFFAPNQVVLSLQAPPTGCAPGDAGCHPAIDHIPQCAVRHG